MNIEKARQYVVHRSNGELTAPKCRALEAFIARHPEFADEVSEMEQAWKKLDLLKGERLAVPAMGHALREWLDSAAGLQRHARRRALQWAAAARVAVILVAVGLASYHLLARPKTGAPTSAPHSPAPAGTPSGVVKAAVAQGGPAIEIPRVTGTPTLFRSRGLVLVRGPQDNRWRLLRKGAEVAFGHSVRVPENSNFCAVLLGSDGSTVTLKAGSEVVCNAQRQWALKAGAAYFAVAKGEERFVVLTPAGWMAALGTEFALYVTPEDKDRGVAGSTVCDVREGKVQIGPPAGQAEIVAEIPAGKSGIVDAQGARLIATGPGSADWLARVQALTESDESIARLVADAGEQGKNLPLEIKSYDVSVTVVDGVARTFLDMVFMNHTDRRLEGTFYYSLPADASISEFAMFVGDKRIAGEVVELQRARQIFEYIRREQRDPALLEWVGGNLFKMRVYPIEPKSDKRIQLGYTQVLRRRETLVSYTFPLVSEMLVKNPLRELSMEVKVLSTPGLYDVDCPTHNVGKGVSDDGTRAVAGFKAKDYTPERDFRLTWRVPDSAECIVLSNRRTDDPDGYFMAQVDPRVPAAPRRPPERLLLVLDGSASVDPQSFSVAREFAGGVCSMVFGWKFNLILSGTAPELLWPDFQVVDWDAAGTVHTFLGARKPLGGTDLLQTFRIVAESVPDGQAVRIVYVGDGIDTLGQLEGAKLADTIAALFKGKEVELSCVAIGSSYDQLVLGNLAAKLGGTFRAVEGVGDVFEAADSILEEFTRPVLRDVNLEFEGIEVAGLYPPSLGTLMVGDTGLVLGRVVKGGPGRIIVTGVADDQSFRREYEVNLTLPEEENQFLPRLWAKAHMDALRAQMGLADAASDTYLKDQIIAVSIDYQIMSPFTAFLVLESEEDYARFGIVRRMRKVDWRGELTGVTHRLPGVAVPAPRPKTISRAQVGPILLPEPGFEVLSGEVRSKLPLMTWDEQRRGRRGDYYDISGRRAGRAGDGIGGGWSFFGGAEGAEKGALVAGDALGARNEALKLKDTELSDFLGKPVAFEDLAGELKEDLKREEPAGEPSDFRGGELAQARLGLDYGTDLFSESRAFSTAMPVAATPPFPGRPAGGPMALDEITALGYASRRSDRYRGSYLPDFRGYLDQQNVTEIVTADGRKLKVDRAWRDEAYTRRAVLVKPDSLQDRLNLALTLLRLGKFGAALGEVDALIQSAGADPNLWFERAWLQAQLGQKDAAFESLQKAAALADQNKDQRETLRSRYASQLSAIGRHAEASREYEALGEASGADNPSVNYFTSAYSAAVSAGATDAVRLLDRALQKWPDSAYALERVARSLQAADALRALSLAEKAQELGQDTYALRAQILFNMGKKEELWQLVGDWFGKAANASQAQQALNWCYQRDNARALALAGQAIEEAKRPQLDGAVWFAQSYGLSAAAMKKLSERALGQDFPADLRTQAFYALQNRGGRSDEWVGVLVPLLADPSVQETRAQAFSALAALVSHGHYGPVSKCLDAFLKVENLTDNELQQVTNARWQVEWNTGRQKEALEHLEAAFRATSVAGQAYNYASTMLYPLIQRGEHERATEIVADLLRRFPDHENNMYVVRNLLQYLYQAGQAEFIPQALETIQKQAAVAALKEEQERSAGIVKIVEQKDYSAADAQLREFGASLEKRIKELNQRIDDLDARIEAARKAAQPPADAANRSNTPDRTDPATAEPPTKPPQPPAPKQEDQKGGQIQNPQPGASLEDLTKERQQVMREYASLADLLDWALRLRPRVAAMDGQVRAMFMAECRDRAEGEDPVTRPWTNAALACLRFAADWQGYRDTLQRLCNAEPRDPIWPRLLVNACLLAEDAEGALALLNRLAEEDPQDVSIAVTRHALIEKTGKPEEVAAATRQLLEALKREPNTLQQYAQACENAQRWDLAADAWLALGETQAYASNGWPIYQAANVVQRLGDNQRAAELYLRVLETPSWAASQGVQAAQRLSELVQAEEVVRIVEQKLPALLASQEPMTRGYALVLACNVARARNQKDQADAYLAALAELPLKNGMQLGYQVLQMLQAEKRYAELADYARTGGGEVSDSDRRNLLDYAAGMLRNQQESHSFAIALFRELAQSGVDADRYRCEVARVLAEDNKVDEALKELDKIEVLTTRSEYWNAVEQVVQAYHNRKDNVTATRVALDAWRKQGRTMQNYGSNMWYRLCESAWQALQAGQLPVDLTEALTAEVRDLAARDLAGGSDPRIVAHSYAWGLIERLVLAQEILKLAEEAARGEDPQRMIRAAEVYKRAATHEALRQQYMDRAAAICRDLLALAITPTEVRSNACGMLYRIYTDYDQKNWQAALDVLEAWSATGSLDKGDYLQRHVNCLYSLGRRDDARKDVEELLKRPEYRRNYGEGNWLAKRCREAQDYEMEVRVREQQVLVLRWRGELEASNVSRLYTALAGAYASQGDGQKAIDACLRGLSLIDRNQQRGHHQNLRRTLLGIIGKQVPGGLDAVVAHYEKTMTAEGEMPQMRIVFGEAYREAGEEQKALSQFSIAADLLPKDTVLRKEVIDGYRRLGQQDKAEEAYLSWAKLDPQNIEVYRGLGQLYEELGRQQDAMAAYATMAEVRPREAEGHRAYAQVLVAKKYGRDAVTHYLKAVQYRPTQFDIASELAGVYETLGRTDDIPAVWTNGEAACHRSMEDLPDDPLPWLNLARFLKAQGRKDEARELCQRILVRPWPRFASETRTEAGVILGSLN